MLKSKKIEKLERLKASRELMEGNKAVLAVLDQQIKSLQEEIDRENDCPLLTAEEIKEIEIEIQKKEKEISKMANKHRIEINKRIKSLNEFINSLNESLLKEKKELADSKKILFEKLKNQKQKGFVEIQPEDIEKFFISVFQVRI